MSETSNKEYLILRLRHCVQALACPAEAQLGLLPDFVCKADELALEFDHGFRCTTNNHPGEFSQEQMSAFQDIDVLLESMSGPAHPDLWTEDAVRFSVEWGRVREAAEMALKAMGWPLEIPPSHGDEYVPGTSG